VRIIRKNQKIDRSLNVSENFSPCRGLTRREKERKKEKDYRNDYATARTNANVNANGIGHYDNN